MDPGPTTSLGSAQAMLAAIVQSSHDAIIGKSLAGRILSWNPGAERLYGWTAAEAVGQSVELLVPDDQRVIEGDLLDRILAGERLDAFRVTRRNKSGEIVDVSLSMSPILDADGQTVGVATSSRDAGERRRDEAGFQLILDAAPDAMVCVDVYGVITFVNSQVAELFHYSADDLVGQSVELLVPDSVQAGHEIRRTGYLTDPQPRAMGVGQQLQARRKDGTLFPADISLAAVESAAGLITIAAVRDVSERLAVNAALLESEQRFQQLAANTDVGFFLRTVEPSDYLYVNQAFLRIFDLTDHGTGPPITQAQTAERIHPDDRELFLQTASAANAGASVDAEVRVTTRNGDVRWVKLIDTPVANDSDVVVRVAGTVEDITERNRAEAARESAQQEAVDANRAKSEFLSRMSHELRTPLNAVLGFAQLLELDVLSDHQDAAVRQILRGGRHLLDLIDDVLDISQIETNHLDVSLEPVHVQGVVQESIELMRPMATTKSVQVRCDLSHLDRDCFVRADLRRLRQVLLNLLSNAIKYNKVGGDVVLTCAATGAGRLDIAVVDSGAGIAEDFLPRLFTPFDRLGAEATEVEGSGIGLALTKRLLSIMDGRIDVQSDRGIGSTFTISLPLVDSPLSPVHSDAGPQSPGLLVHETRSTLLYIEDNHSNVELVERILDRRPGWTLVPAGHGALGLDLALTCEPALILLDLHLPDMNGIDVMHALRADPITTDIPLAIVSADASPGQIRRLKAAGARHYLTKPLAVTEILDLLDEYAQHNTEHVATRSTASTRTK